MRGDTWYMRWRCNGVETTRSTGISANEPRGKEKAEAILYEATEILRLKDKKMQLEVVKNMISSTEDKMQDLVLGVKRDLQISDLAETFEKSSRRIDCSPSMLNIYKNYIGELATIIGSEFPVSAIDARVADTVARQLAVNRSPNTYNKYLNGLTLVWKAIMPTVDIHHNPWADIPRKRLDTKTRRILTTEETDKVLETAEGELRKLIAIGLYTGLRMGDAVRLKWGYVSENAISLTTRKTKARVTIPLHPRLVEILGARGAENEMITPEMNRLYDEVGRGATAERVTRLFNKCGIKTSEKKGDMKAVSCCGFHSLRHTFVSRCVDSGVPPHIVQAIVGHTTAKMTEHYTHLNDQTILSAFSAIK